MFVRRYNATAAWLTGKVDSKVLSATHPNVSGKRKKEGRQIHWPIAVPSKLIVLIFNRACRLKYGYFQSFQLWRQLICFYNNDIYRWGDVGGHINLVIKAGFKGSLQGAKLLKKCKKIVQDRGHDNILWQNPNYHRQNHNVKDKGQIITEGKIIKELETFEISKDILN